MCSDCPETLLGEEGGRGRDVALSEGYFFLYFLHLIHLGPKPGSFFLFLPTQLGRLCPLGEWRVRHAGRRSLHVFSSPLLSLEPISLLFQAVLSAGALLTTAPGKGLVISLPREPPTPCGHHDCPSLLCRVEAREGSGGARGASVSGSLQESRGSGASRPGSSHDRKPQQPETLFIGLPFAASLL